jgi:hypothetical protein
VLLPDKHITIAASVLGLSALVLSTIAKPLTFDALMEALEPVLDTPHWPAFHTAESVSLALSFLYALGLLDVTPEGELFRCA